jgi:hypothetical protein
MVMIVQSWSTALTDVGFGDLYANIAKTGEGVEEGDKRGWFSVPIFVAMRATATFAQEGEGSRQDRERGDQAGAGEALTDLLKDAVQRSHPIANRYLRKEKAPSAKRH